MPERIAGLYSTSRCAACHCSDATASSGGLAAITALGASMPAQAAPKAGRRSVLRMAEAWPTATLVHLPVHASWLNQIEIVFSVIQRKVIRPAEFADLDALASRLLAFEARYNTSARPFDWTFTRADLIELCRRIDAHQPTEPLGLAA